LRGRKKVALFFLLGKKFRPWGKNGKRGEARSILGNNGKGKCASRGKEQDASLGTEIRTSKRASAEENGTFERCEVVVRGGVGVKHQRRAEILKSCAFKLLEKRKKKREI